MRFLEVGNAQMQIALRGSQRLMAENLLNVAQVCPVVKEMRCAGVPPDMTGDMFLDVRGTSGLDYQFAKHILVERFSASRNEKIVALAAMRRRGSD